MPTDGFIINEELLKEDSRVDDLLDFHYEISEFEKKLDEITKPSIIGLVGKFGSGKSTMLHQIKKKREAEKIWIDFDAWKYPDRKNLWEGFVLDFARQIDKKTFDKILKEIDGKKGDDKKTLINIISSFPALNVVKNLKHFIKSSPARRTFEVQAILNGMIEKADKDIYIVIEDIDRSGDAGIFFLETLKQYLRNLETEKKVIAIVPIGTEIYKDEKHINYYNKCLDYVTFFQPTFLNFKKFVANNIKDDLLYTKKVNNAKLIASFFQDIYRNKSNVTIRLIKLILRGANLTYKTLNQEGKEPSNKADWRVTVCIEASKRLLVPNTQISYFKHFKDNGYVSQGSVFASFLLALQSDQDSVYYDYVTAEGMEERRNVDRDFSIVPCYSFQEPSIPFDYKLCGFYFRH